MASLIVLCGTILGFVGGVAGYLFLDLSLLAALAVWILSGPLSAALAAIMATAPRGDTSGAVAPQVEAA